MNKRDLELLSSYLDGELKPSDSTKLEARLTSDPELASVLNDLRAARTLLRKLPARKAPRNFTLTRKMVGQNPPLPRAYPIFRFATAAATLLVHGGASGIGTTAIQLAHARGSRVLATAGSAEKVALCRRLGAQRAIDYHEEPFAAVVREETAGRGVDVILDIVGGSYLDANLDALATDGRLVVIGVLGGSRGTLQLGKLLGRRLTITGSTLRAREVAEKGRIAAALEQQVWPLLERRTVVPVLQESMPLADAARAHDILEANAVMGKLALVVDAGL